MNDSASILDNLTAQAGQLYSLPAVAMKVLELTEDPNMDTRELKECIENDPALTCKLLRVVNSSLFGLSREVSDLNQALALLGTKPLKLLVLGFCLPTELFAGLGSEILEWYWRHTLTRAVAAREIAENLFELPGDEAFIAGLLQDLGLLMLIQQLGEPYAKFLEKVVSSGKNLSAMETDLMGFNHTTASAKLLDNWGLPEMLVEAVAQQAVTHRTETLRSSKQALPQILHLAELLSQLLADEQPEALGQLIDTCQEYRGTREVPLEALVEKLEEKVQQLADVLSLKLPGGHDYRDVLVRAHEQLSAVATEAAGDLLRFSQGDAPQSEEDAVVAELRQLALAVAEVARRPEQLGNAGGDTTHAPQPAGDGQSATTATQPYSTGTVTAAGQSDTAVTAAADQTLLRQLAEAAAACRQTRCPLSLLLIQLDRMAELRLTRGVKGLDQLRQFLQTVCMRVDHPSAMCTSHGENGFALVLPDCERRLAVEIANQLIGDLGRLTPSSTGGNRRTVSISVGVATLPMPPRNFLGKSLFTSADRCLYGAISSGGGVVKSIEIF